jgi:hypothetical protein
MSPARLLSFSPEAYAALFEAYNRAVWPVPIAAAALGLMALGLAWRPVPGGGRWIGAVLAAFWAWNGILYHGVFFAEINFLAPAFGGLFVLQALLLGWTAARGRIPARGIKHCAPTGAGGVLVFRFRPDLAGRTGLALALAALAGYPLLGLLAGHDLARQALFGIAPAPTVVFTLGLLLAAEGRAARPLLAVPLLWALVGGLLAGVLGAPEDLLLLLAAFAAGGAIWAESRRAKT